MAAFRLTLLLLLLTAVTVRGASNCHFYHFKVGGVNATVVSDGFAVADINGTFPGVHPEAVKLAQSLNFIEEGSLFFHYNPLYLDMGGRKVIIDVGSADNFGPTLGKLLENMAAAGLDPEAVDDVLLTHGHLDHLGGLLKPGGGGLAFPKARVHISRDEYEFWMRSTVDDMPLAFPLNLRQLLLDVAKNSLTAVSEKIELFEIGDEVIPGITSWGAGGHTPGQTAFIIRDGDASLLHAADVLVWDAYSIQHPDWGLSFDLDIPSGVMARFSLLKELASSGMMFLSYHNDFPGLGHIFETGQGYGLRQARFQF